MSQENVDSVRVVRLDLSGHAEAASQRRRTLDERLFVRFPAVYMLFARMCMRLSPRSRLRRAAFSRSVPRTCAAFNRRDFPVFLLGFHPGVEFHGARDLLGPDQAEVAYGRDGILEFLQSWTDAFEGLRFEPEQLLDLGDKFLVTTQLRGQGAGSGVAMSQRLFVCSHVRRGSVVKQENFLDRSSALEAVGLRE
jgi:ketosteroid isomerase-like protein